MGYAALITGAGRGIGKGIALSLAAEGFAVAVNDLTLGADVEQTVAELLAIGVRAVAVIGNVSDHEVHARMLDEAEAALGPLTTLVNNAGVGVMRRGDLLDVTPESFDRCQAVNARGGFFLTQSWAKRILRRDRPAALHHCVITVTSSNAQAVSISRGEYCVSKAAAAMTAKLFAVRLGPFGVGCYAIQPGLIETPMTAPVLDDYRRRIAEDELTVVAHMGQPSDIGSIAAALATGRLAFCTGQVLHADGGLLIPRF
ncbi:MAG: 3-ketoacyl-ACP reductase [Devosia sp.]|nr:3-ketoacyl-ACP reductase [Devosia sp.]